MHNRRRMPPVVALSIARRSLVRSRSFWVAPNIGCLNWTDDGSINISDSKTRRQPPMNKWRIGCAAKERQKYVDNPAAVNHSSERIGIFPALKTRCVPSGRTGDRRNARGTNRVSTTAPCNTGSERIVASKNHEHIEPLIDPCSSRNNCRLVVTCTYRTLD